MAAAGLLVAGALGWWTFTPRRGTGDAAGSGPGLPPCERLNFPCTLADVTIGTLRHSLALGKIVADRIQTEDSSSIAAWVQAQLDVVEVLHDETTVAFRLAGGRRLWVSRDLLQPERSGDLHPSGGAHPVQTGPRSTGAPTRGWSVRRRPPVRPRQDRLQAALSLVPLPVVLRAQESGTGGSKPRRGGVVGQDLTGDGKINQRDKRLALILEPPADHSNGLAVQQLLEGVAAYKDGVVYLKGAEAGVEQFTNWDAFDVVHVDTTATSPCVERSDDPASGRECYWLLETGTAVSAEKLDGLSPTLSGEYIGTNPFEGTPDEPGDDFREAMSEQGLEIVADLGENGLEWRLFVSKWFFGVAYPNGVRRAVVFLNIPNKQNAVGLVRILAGSPGRSTVVRWEVNNSVDERASVAAWFYQLAVQGYSAGDIITGPSLAPPPPCADAPTGSFCGTGLVEADLRIREIGTLLTSRRLFEAPRVIEDGRGLETLMEGWSDPPEINVTVDIDGILRDEGDAELVGDGQSASGAPPDPNAPVRLELDGKPIAEHRLSEAKPIGGGPPYRLRLPFDRVPLQMALEDGREYALEAVVTLPRGGESRYEARLPYHATFVDYSGSITGHFTPDTTGFRLWPRGDIPPGQCFWELHLKGKDGDMVDVYGLLPKPPGPGTYPVTATPPGGIGLPAPGTAVASALPACPLRTDCSAGLPWGRSLDGSIHLDELSRSRATGGFVINFQEGRRGPRYTTSGRFSVPLAGAAFGGGGSANNSCRPATGG
jgi:hypothetical protein